MTSRDTNLNVNVTATDRATTTVRQVGAEVAKVEGTHEIELDAAGDADDHLKSIRSKLDQLTDSDKQIVLKGQADQLVREVARAERKLADLDKYDGDEIRVIVDARDQASKKLDAVRTELRQLDGDSADVRVNVHDPSAGTDGSGGILSLLNSRYGAAGIGAALAAGLASGVEQAHKLTGEVATTADLTNSTLDTASRLVSVWNGAGLEVSDLLDIVLNVNSVLATTPELAAQLKIKPGNDLLVTFLDTVEAINTQLGEGSDKAQVMSQLFGEEGVRQVGALTTAVGDLKTAVDDVPEANTIDEQDVERWRKANENIKELKQHWQELALFLSETVVPLLNTIAEWNPARIGTAIGKWLQPAFFPGEDTEGEQRVNDVIARNTAGYYGGAAYGMAPGATGTPGHVPAGANPYGLAGPATIAYIFNPPGTPTGWNQQGETYVRRNGVRLS